VPDALLLEGMQALFDLAGELRPGRLLLLKHNCRPSHLAIVTGDGRAVHAFPGHKARVCERGIDVLFHKFPLHSIWKIRRCR
jgi:cell wall-associated NlpC family hydrolase